MKTLLITIGVPGCGKSTWIRENGLEQYSICPDKIRLLFSSPVMDTFGTFGISQKNDSKVWKMVFELIETRMKKGMFTILDATNINKGTISTLEKLCHKYGFRFYAKKFEVPLDVLLERNENRDRLLRIPTEVIEKMFNRLQVFESKKFKLVESINETYEIVKNTEINSENIYVIGDVHGCYQQLIDFFDTVNIEKDFFIFTGDYIDRGPDNDKTLNFLMNKTEKENFVFLEGNHERWLRCWLNEEEIKSKEFTEKTLPQIELNCDKKEIELFVRRLRYFIQFKSADKTFIACHGGISTWKFDFISGDQLINGVGNYEEASQIAKFFEASCDFDKKDFYLIHGHRNVEELHIKVNNRVYNLEGQVEFGGHLRVVKITNGEITPLEFKSNIKTEMSVVIYNKHEIRSLKNSKLVKEKKLANNISSYNFTREAFYTKSWNNTAIKARGLFIRDDGKIVARSYNKFFNINEMPETKFEILEFKFKFPVYGYSKENGYLGIIGYDDKIDESLFCSKSTNEGDFAEWFKGLVYKKLDSNKRALLKAKLREMDASAIFEVVLVEKDPHIIKYSCDSLILLDVIKNNFKSEKLNYSDLVIFARDLGLNVKTIENISYNWEEFVENYNKAEKSQNEGIVYEDSVGFQVKQKTEFYNKWKALRSICEGLLKRPDAQIKIKDPESIKFIEWFKEQSEDVKQLSIIDLRKMFEGENV